MSVRRDRHGRGMRGPLAWPPVPAMGTRTQRFDAMVLDAVEAVRRRLGEEGRFDLQVSVEDVPPADPRLWVDGVPLAGSPEPEPLGPARLVVYRRPLTQRAEDEQDLAELVHEVVAEQVARMLGRDPDDLL